MMFNNKSREGYILIIIGLLFIVIISSFIIISNYFSNSENNEGGHQGDNFVKSKDSQNDNEKSASSSKGELDVFFEREISNEIEKGSKIIVNLKVSCDFPREIEIYEKLPEGFQISISNDRLNENIESDKLENNLYMYRTIDNTSSVGLRYILEVSDKIEPGEYKIEGWVESGNKKKETDISEIRVLE